jgi:uncharacterized BrkB/YihY/UPF0761 family membrane protein
MESTADQKSTRMLMKPRVAFGLLKSALSACLNDNVQRMSAALAYYTIFSLAPLLVIAIAIAGLVFGEDAARGEIVGEIQELVGQDGARAIQAMAEFTEVYAHQCGPRLAVTLSSPTLTPT